MHSMSLGAQAARQDSRGVESWKLRGLDMNEIHKATNMTDTISHWGHICITRQDMCFGDGKNHTFSSIMQYMQAKSLLPVQ